MRDYTILSDPALLADEDAINAALRKIEQNPSAANCIAIVEQFLSAEQSYSIAIFLSGE